MSVVSPTWLSLSGEANYIRSTYIDGFLDVSSSRGVLLRSDVSFGQRLMFPPLVGFTGTVSPNSTAATSTTWANYGVTWNCSASSNLGGYDAFRAFNSYNNPLGYANSTQNTSTTTTPSSFSTTLYGSNGTAEVSAASSFSQNGEWLQIQSSVPATMKDFNLVGGGSPIQVPRVFYIAGSTNGTFWYPLGKYTLSAGNTVKDAIGNVSSTITISTSNQSVTNYSSTGYSFAANSYSYFRLIILNTYTSSNAYVEMNEWNINFTPATSAITLAPSTTAYGQLDLTGGLTTTQNVGIGITNPAYPLHVNGTVNCGNIGCGNLTSNGISMLVGNPGNGTNYGSNNIIEFAPVNTVGVIWNMGNGTTSNSFFIYGQNGTSRSGGVTMGYGATSWSAMSDERIKTDIIPVENSLEKLLQIIPVTYRVKTNVDKLLVGFTAQNVGQYFPIVAGFEIGSDDIDDDGNKFSVLGITITDLIPYIVKGMQEQQVLIQSQQTQIQSQQTQIDALVARLAAAGIA